MSISFACPGCGAAYHVAERKTGKRTTCPKCGQGMRVPPPVRRMAVPGMETPEVATEETDPRSRRMATVFYLLNWIIFGAIVGCAAGYYFAHHAPLFGGLYMLGMPYSPARDTLVPGHVLLCGILCGLLGLGAGCLIRYLIREAR